MKSILLSHTIGDKTPFYVGTTRPTITPNNQISMGDNYNTYILTIGNHCGTHIDAPNHFIPTGKRISDYSIEKLIFNNPMILNCPKEPEELIEVKDLPEGELEGVDCLFFRTGFEKYRTSDPDTYLTLNPGIGPELVLWIRKNFKNIQCLGIDCVSITSYKKEDLGKKAHINAFKDDSDLGNPLLLIEDMDLKVNPNDSLKRVTVLPWQIEKIDSAPCTVLADLE